MMVMIQTVAWAHVVFVTVNMNAHRLQMYAFAAKYMPLVLNVALEIMALSAKSQLIMIFHQETSKMAQTHVPAGLMVNVHQSKSAKRYLEICSSLFSKTSMDIST